MACNSRTFNTMGIDAALWASNIAALTAIDARLLSILLTIFARCGLANAIQGSSCALSPAFAGLRTRTDLSTKVSPKIPVAHSSGRAVPILSSRGADPVAM